MKKMAAGLLCLLIALSVSGCKSKEDQGQNNNTDLNGAATAGMSETVNPVESGQTSINSTDIILDIEKVLTVSGKGAVDGVLRSDILTGAGVQIVGVGKKPLSAEISAILLNGAPKSPAKSGEAVRLVFNVDESDLQDMQRVIIAKDRKESELKSVTSFDDVLGKVSENVYSNESFGFSIHGGETGFAARENSQEGFKVSFKSPGSFYDNSVLYIESQDHTSYIIMAVSDIRAINNQTAAKQLAYEYQQYGVKTKQILLGDKEAAYAQIKDGDTITDYYAMIINGYYIKWSVMEKNGAYKKELAEIMNSLRFNWVKE